MQSNLSLSIAHIVAETFYTIFTPDGVEFNAQGFIWNGNQVKGWGEFEPFSSISFLTAILEENQKPPLEPEQKNLLYFLTNPLIMISSFVGLPNRFLNQTPSWLALAHNFVGWDENVSENKKNLNLLLMLPRIIFNSISIPLTLILNIIKVFTEFLPQTLGKITGRISKRLISIAFSNSALSPSKKEYSLLIRLISFIGGLVMFGLSASFHSLSFLGNLTSPKKNAELGWINGKSFGLFVGKAWFGKDRANIIGNIFGAFRAGLNIAVSLVGFAFLLPFAHIFYYKEVLSVGHFLTSHAPLLSKAFNATAQFIMPFLNTFGSSIIPFISRGIEASSMSLLSVKSTIATFNPALIGLGGAFGIGIATLGPLVDKAKQKISNWWHRKDRGSNTHNTIDHASAENIVFHDNTLEASLTEQNNHGKTSTKIITNYLNSNSKPIHPHEEYLSSFNRILDEDQELKNFDPKLTKFVKELYYYELYNAVYLADFFVKNAIENVKHGVQIMHNLLNDHIVDDNVISELEKKNPAILKSVLENYKEYSLDKSKPELLALFFPNFTLESKFRIEANNVGASLKEPLIEPQKMEL